MATLTRFMLTELETARLQSKPETIPTPVQPENRAEQRNRNTEPTEKTERPNRRKNRLTDDDKVF